MLSVQFTCAAELWTTLLPQAQGAQCHSVSPIWEPLEWNVEHNVGFQHLPMYLWTLLACLDSSLSFLITSVLSPCKNNILIEVLQRVLGTNFWTPGCRRVIIFEKPSSCLKCLTCNLAFICSYNVLGVLQSLHPFLVSSHLFGLCKVWAYTIYFTS